MNKTQITVRAMEKEDAEAFLTTLRDSIRHVASADYPASVIESWAPVVSAESIELTQKNLEQEIRVVAELNGEIVGIGSTVLELRQLRACYVSPGGLRKGVGTAIVQELETIARRSGIPRFELHATITAEPFYQRLGYFSEQRITHRTSSGAELQAVLMSKNL